VRQVIFPPSEVDRWVTPLLFAAALLVGSRS
jgi:hypothetical protein